MAGFSRAASFNARVEALFRPPLGELTTLSPDGQRVAYTSRAGGKLAIVIMNVENPGGRKRTVPVEPESDATSAENKSPVQLRLLRWATADRLVYAPAERVVPLPPVTNKTDAPRPIPTGPRFSRRSWRWMPTARSAAR